MAQCFERMRGNFAILIIYITVNTKLQKSCPHPPIKNWMIWPIFIICCHSIKSLMVCVPSAIILLIVFQDAAALSHDLKFFVHTESTNWSQWDLMSKYWRTLLISLRGKEQQGNVSGGEAVLLLWTAVGTGCTGEHAWICPQYYMLNSTQSTCWVAVWKFRINSEDRHKTGTCFP